jgi:ElaB/YqjD/DUF883 family membrane-anchored ribosome-binding protein
MKNELQKLKEQLDSLLAYTGTDSNEVLSISRKIDILVNEKYMNKHFNRQNYSNKRIKD